MRRRPAFFAISTVTLGLALAFATTVFSVVDSFRHPTVPFAEPDRTFWVQWWGGTDRVHPGATPDELETAVRGVPAFDQLATSSSKAVMAQVGDRSARRFAAPVSANLFDVIRVRPRIGRLFQADDAREGRGVIVSDQLWRTYFEDRPEIGRAEISLDDRLYTIVGVMPRGVHGYAPSEPDVWRLYEPGDLKTPWLTAHLRTGVSRKTAEAQLATLAARLTQVYRSEARPYGFTLHDLRPNPDRQLTLLHKAMLGLALCVLFIACGNIATLLLARAVTRRRDLALRLSLGAGHRALVMDQFAEVTLLAVAGALAGLILASWGSSLASHWVPAEMRSLATLDPHWSWRLFAIVLATVVSVVILTGLLPAWQVGRLQPIDPLKEASGSTTGRTAHRMKFLVVTELATSLVLLVGAAVFTRFALRLARFDFGFDPRPLVTASGRFVYRWDLERFGSRDPSTEMLARAKGTAGVESATSLAFGQPDRNAVYSDVTVGDTVPLLAGSYYIVGPHFFHTLGIPLLRGRDFEAGDAATGAVILDERAVPLLFRGGEAIGRRVKFGSPERPGPWFRVIGVARRADIYPTPPEGPRWPPLYASVERHDQRAPWTIVARVRGSIPSAVMRLDRGLNSAFSSRAAAHVDAFNAGFERMQRRTSDYTRLFVVLGAASLALAAAGLFAVLAYTVSQRMREFGVRMALGASPPALLGLVLKDSVEMALAGTGLGAFGALALGALYGDLWFGDNPIDAVALGVAEAVLLLVALSASVAPALRATRADPLEILRAT